MTDPIRAAFTRQSDACARLGSPFTAWLCQRLGQELDTTTPIGRRVLGWSGDPSAAADALALRICGALHARALTAPADHALTRAYQDLQTDDATWAVIHAALLDDPDDMLDRLQSPPQTNEVGRAAMVYAGLIWLRGQCPLPQSLWEIGASAGLNLNLHRFGYRLGDWAARTDAPLVLAPDWQGAPITGPAPDICDSQGCDLRPVDITTDAAQNRLRAYVWPDQPHRMARLNAALGIAAQHPPAVVRADAIDWLAQPLTPQTNRLRVIYSTIAWQYLPPKARAAGAAQIAAAGAKATAKAPLAWLRFEGDGAHPGAAIDLTLWDGSMRAWQLGRADYHGGWIDWGPVPS